MASHLMNFRKYLIKIWCVLFYRRHHTFDVKTCFQQNRYVFDVIQYLCFIYFNNRLKYVSGARLRRKYLISSETVEISSKFYEIRTVNKSRSWRHNDVKYVPILLEASFNIKSVMQILQAFWWRFKVWEARYFLSLP
jgi:hypothetical protein